VGAHGVCARPDEIRLVRAHNLARSALTPTARGSAEANGKEPRFTNYARTAGMEDTFAHTLDYVFFSDGLKFKGRTARLRVRGVRDLQDLCAAIAQNEKSLPSEAEPSDHLLIAADFDLVSEEAEKKLPADGAWVKVEQ
jgi:mRNA deadenylase 3'-5' endonuclease subunit Ccr4